MSFLDMRLVRLLTFSALALTIGCATNTTSTIAASSAPTTTTDSSGTKPVAIPIAAIGGDITEILYALESDGAIAAIDTTSVFPPRALKEKRNVGYMRALSTEGVLATGAKTIIASDGAGPPEVIAALKSAKISFHEISAPDTADGVISKIKDVGALVGKSETADALVVGIAQSFKDLDAARQKIGTKRRVLFVLATQDGRMTVGGSKTSADALLNLAGAENAAAEVQGFKPVTDEQLVALAPDAVVVMKRSGLKSDPVEDVRNARGLQSSPAVASNKVFGMDGQYALSFGPRAANAALDLLKKVYPEHADSKAGQ